MAAKGQREKQDGTDLQDLQAQLDASIAVVDQLVQSWIPEKSTSHQTQNQDATALHLHATLDTRLPGLGLGAKPSSVTERKVSEANLRKKLQNKRTDTSQSRNNDHVQHGIAEPSTESDDEESKATFVGASTKRPIASAFSMFETKASKKGKFKQELLVREQDKLDEKVLQKEEDPPSLGMNSTNTSNNEDTSNAKESYSKDTNRRSDQGPSKSKHSKIDKSETMSKKKKQGMSVSEKRRRLYDKVKKREHSGAS